MAVELTKKQKELMKKHKAHHTAKHMAFMTKEMKKRKSFTASHKLAQKKIGK